MLRMKIARLEITNFRLLKNFSLDLEDELSLVIGKNNTGKTSILACLEKMVIQGDKKAICYDDFNVNLRTELESVLAGTKQIGTEEEYKALGIQLKIFIEYYEDDDLSQVSSVIMSLDPADNMIILSFEYMISFWQLEKMKADYEEKKANFDDNVTLYLKTHLHDFFGNISKKSLLSTDEGQSIDLQQQKINIRNILDIAFISAKRSVTNKKNDKTLSTQTASLYKQVDESEEQLDISEEFQKALRKTDQTLDGIYEGIFKSVIKKVNEFGGINPNETKIKIASSLQHKELLEGNTTVLYTQDDYDLPEHFNGLGYMNLISMIFEIEMLMTKLRRSQNEKPAAINLLFIEEPEAHTHPQMQYVFIKNIKKLLKESRKRDDNVTIHLQSIITTHSSHIVSESMFDDIKYLRKSLENKEVEAKNLKDLEKAYSNEEDAAQNSKLKQSYKFLKQYLTLNKAELFFADKAILFEGDTERVLLPAMMKKIDQDNQDENVTPLLSQNVSIVEVGAHSQTFEKFIHFIGIKSLIITDIDSFFEAPELEEDGTTPKSYKNGNPILKEHPRPPQDNRTTKTSNNSLMFFFNQNNNLNFFKDLSAEQKILLKDEENNWVQDINGQLMIVYQTEEDGYHARSFEDAFFSLNKSLLGTDPNNFASLTKKHFNRFINGESDVFDFSEKAVNSKPSLAIEILFNSKNDPETGYEFANWKVPSYIKEGLLWLKKD